MSQHFVIMGICGCGKTTAAQTVQNHLNCPYAEGDDFHTQANRDKMGAGIPLTDEDRAPWLANLRDWMSEQTRAGKPYSVVTCSALKKAYRDILRGADGEVYFIHLAPPVEVNRERMAARQGHYMKASMVDSQLAILEPLQADERGVVIDSAGTPEEVGKIITAWLDSVKK
ncbi:gluconokinase [Alysiella crassa]|uniref:Gluconokinase n=1 Tax=Alysiella crassa TaxID=153491 RepID=A0A376BL61_9NEIS|nr:gluconokinase, GntK/IdnK-type [Alysiella crassa]UOP07378.1 gluconokinase, GntK/IdnK-type [Alysiella crassa]SSY70441.1 Thermoresistant gluconokinase [Alysiella crassa]